MIRTKMVRTVRLCRFPYETLTWGTWSGSTFHLQNRSQRSQILIFKRQGISIHQISRKLIYLVGALSKLEKTSVTEF